MAVAKIHKANLINRLKTHIQENNRNLARCAAWRDKKNYDKRNYALRKILNAIERGDFDVT